MKKLLLITFVFMFIFTTSALAHTGLETSSPEDGEVVTEEMREIALTYEGKIEQGGTLEVSNSNGQSIPVEDISIADTQMTGTFTNALENGDYTVVWNIIGADGHPIAGEFSFTVDVPVSETAVENESEANSQDVNQDETPLENVEDTKTNEQSQLPSYLIPVIVIVLIAIIVGIFVGLRRKK
ncbi:copper resistance protein CopC [Sporosarcina sp. resist]|uniref:copper resistance CopC family protein n=1 Tax=Sporosarcina sp. resist TaxID=2762563 RepID=UPI00164E1D57|nr:copper resistance protein CopC [Sporosarcina sp. resist]QNK88520.1 copper resistance protein CopC [Sporosarcina sp. resist]